MGFVAKTCQTCDVMCRDGVYYGFVKGTFENLRRDYGSLAELQLNLMLTKYVPSKGGKHEAEFKASNDVVLQYE